MQRDFSDTLKVNASLFHGDYDKLYQNFFADDHASEFLDVGDWLEAERVSEAHSGRPTSIQRRYIDKSTIASSFVEPHQRIFDGRLQPLADWWCRDKNSAPIRFDGWMMGCGLPGNDHRAGVFAIADRIRRYSWRRSRNVIPSPPEGAKSGLE